MSEVKDNKYFCVLPFVGTCIEAGGRFKPCCKYEAWDNSEKAKDMSLTQIIQAPSYQAIREDMINNVKHSGCHRCWEDEENDIQSFRQQSNEQFINLYKEDNLSVKVIDFGFGNTCNAACITCESSSSQRWSKEDKILSEIKGNPFRRLYFPPVEDQFSWSEEEYKNIQHIMHAQNEVFASNEFVRFLKKLDEFSDLNNKSILISTNGSIWPSEEIIERLKKFKKCHIQISIDGLKEVNNYIRYPLKWEKVDELTQKWLTLSDESGIKVTARCTISMYNILHIDKLKTWWKDISNNRNMSFGYCWFPEYLSPLVYAKSLQPLIEQHLDYIPELSKIINKKTDDNENKVMFKEFTSKMDSMRGLNYQKSLPELDQFLSEKMNR